MSAIYTKDFSLAQGLGEDTASGALLMFCLIKLCQRELKVSAVSPGLPHILERPGSTNVQLVESSSAAASSAASSF